MTGGPTTSAIKLNDPFKGVVLVRACVDPTAGRHSLQLEVENSSVARPKQLSKAGKQRAGSLRQRY